jgi:hypothetical protein
MAQEEIVGASWRARVSQAVYLSGVPASLKKADAYPGVPVVEKPFQAQDLLDALRKVLIR